MFPMPAVPTYNEWVVLMQHDPVQANQLMIALKARNMQQGLFADASLTISLEGYAQARRLLAAATTDSQHAQRVADSTRLGQATLGPYPDREAWVRLITDDPSFAQALYGALQAKQSMFGGQTPHDLLKSYRRLRVRARGTDIARGARFIL